MDRLTEEIAQIVKECGIFILNADREHTRVLNKEGHANFVTEYDQKVQEMLKTKLLKLLPKACFEGEESSEKPDINEGYVFIVDPIDGTTNFIKDYHVSAVSVGLLKDGKQLIGVVYNPYLDEMYCARAGEGAYLNGERIRVSDRPLSEGLVVIGTAPYYSELNEKTFELAKYYFKRSMDIRRSGSAAIDLCSIAAGRAELYFELRLQPWDFAAGSLIVKEAGGAVKTAEGDALRFDRACSVIATNHVCRDE